MNIVKLQDSLKDLSDRQLLDTMQTASAPQYLVLAEMQRRKELRSGAERQQPQAETSVAEEIMGGIASMPVQNAMPQMASGGIVGFAGGGKLSGYKKGMAEACYENPVTGATECPPSKPDLRTPRTKKMADGGLVGEDLQRLSEILKGYESSKSHTDALGRVKKSKDGALGMMQVMPVTAAQPGAGISKNIFQIADEFKIPYDSEAAKKKVMRNGSPYPAPEAQAEAARLLAMPEVNIMFGDTYLKGLSKRYDGDVEATAIAYNAGPTQADRFLRSGRDYSVLRRRSETEPYAKGITKDYGADSEHAEVMRQLAAIDAKEAQMLAERAANTPDEGIMQVLPAESRPRPVPLGETVDRSGEATFDWSSIPGDSQLRSGPDLSEEMYKPSPSVEQSMRDYPEGEKTVEREERGGLLGILDSLSGLFGGSQEEPAPVEGRNPPPSNQDWVDPDTGYSLRDLKDYFDEQKILSDLNKEQRGAPLASFKEGGKTDKDEKSFYEWLTALANSGAMTESGTPSETVAPMSIDRDAPGEDMNFNPYMPPRNTDDPSLDFTEPPAEAYKKAPAPQKKVRADSQEGIRRLANMQDYDPDAPGEDMNVQPEVGYPFPTTNPDRDPAFKRVSPRLEAARKAEELAKKRAEESAAAAPIIAQVPTDSVDPFATQAQTDAIRAQAQADSEAAAQQRVDDATTFAEKRDAKKKQEGVAAYYEQQKAKEDKATEAAQKKATEELAKTGGAKASGFRKDDVKSEGIQSVLTDSEYFADLRRRIREAESKDPRQKMYDAMIAGGLTAAAGKSPDFLTNIATGGLGALKQYKSDAAAEKEEILNLLKEEGDIRAASAANEYKNYALMLGQQTKALDAWAKVAAKPGFRPEVAKNLKNSLKRDPQPAEIDAAIERLKEQFVASRLSLGGPSLTGMPISKESVTLATD
jgi:hypothetical protein